MNELTIPIWYIHLGVTMVFMIIWLLWLRRSLNDWSNFFEFYFLTPVMGCLYLIYWVIYLGFFK